MIIVEVEQVEVDYCPKCKGVWLDSGELELLAEMAGAEPGPLSRALESGGRKAAGQKRRCPICRKKMLQVEIPGPPPVVVDKCRVGHGVWLDDRELGLLIEGAGGTAETEMLARLCGRGGKANQPS